MAFELTKALEEFTRYLTKQSSERRWKRSVTFSRGFPKPDSQWISEFGQEWFKELLEYRKGNMVESNSI